jgi:hypothetical protein
MPPRRAGAVAITPTVETPDPGANRICETFKYSSRDNCIISLPPDGNHSVSAQNGNPAAI